MTRRWSPLVVSGAFALVACGLILAATLPHGPGLAIDSTTYLLAADSYPDRELVGLVLNGVFPPGYPAAVAVAAIGIDDVQHAALAVNLVAVAAIVVLVGLTVAGPSGRDDEAPAPTDRRRLVAVAVACAVVTSSVPFLEWSATAMSEALSIALVLGAVFAGAHAARQSSPVLWAVAGLCSGTAVLVRLVAGGSLLALVVGALLVTAGGWRVRARAAAAVGLTGAAIFLLGSRLLAGEAASRRVIAWHPPDSDDLREALDTAASYLLPSSLGTGVARVVAGLAIVALLVSVGVAVWSARRRLTDVPPGAWLAGLVAAAHVGAVAGSMALLDDLTPADPRILLPAVPLAVAALGAAVAARRPILSPVVWLVVAGVVLVGQLGRVVEFVSDARRDGIGYASTLFDPSGTLAAARALPEGTVLWSNDISLLYLRGDRTSFQLPSSIDPYSSQPSTVYDIQLDALARSLDDGAVIVEFDYFDNPLMPSTDELQRLVGPLELVDFGDGRLARRPG